MITWRTIAITGGVSLFTLGSKVIGDHHCCEFPSACVSAPIGTFSAAGCQVRGGVFHLSIQCSQGSGQCTAIKSGGSPPICSDPGSSDCAALLGPDVVPALSEWGLAGVAMLVMIVGSIAVGRRPRPSV